MYCYLCLNYHRLAWLSATDVGHINEVALRRARLVLGWVTVSTPGNWPPGQLSRAIRLWVGTMNTS